MDFAVDAHAARGKIKAIIVFQHFKICRTDKHNLYMYMFNFRI